MCQACRRRKEKEDAEMNQQAEKWEIRFRNRWEVVRQFLETLSRNLVDVVDLFKGPTSEINENDQISWSNFQEAVEHLFPNNIVVPKTLHGSVCAERAFTRITHHTDESLRTFISSRSRSRFSSMESKSFNLVGLTLSNSRLGNSTNSMDSKVLNLPTASSKSRKDMDTTRLNLMTPFASLKRWKEDGVAVDSGPSAKTQGSAPSSGESNIVLELPAASMRDMDSLKYTLDYTMANLEKMMVGDSGEWRWTFTLKELKESLRVMDLMKEFGSLAVTTDFPTELLEEMLPDPVIDSQALA